MADVTGSPTMAARALQRMNGAMTPAHNFVVKHRIVDAQASRRPKLNTTSCTSAARTPSPEPAGRRRSHKMTPEKPKRTIWVVHGPAATITREDPK